MARHLPAILAQVPAGFHTLTPRLAVSDVGGAVEFLRSVFDDAAYARAARAVTIEEPLDTPYGDRRAMVRDPFGNVCQITHRRPTAAP